MVWNAYTTRSIYLLDFDTMQLKQELEVRWFLKQYTNEKLFDLYEEWWRNFYFGVDPSADSMTIGNFCALMQCVHYMSKWNKCYFVVGGATWMIWNPSWKDAERNFLDEEQLAINQKWIHDDIQRVCKNIQLATWRELEYEIVNNYDRFKSYTYLDFLRDVWKCMTVNRMMNKDIVKKRIQTEDQSISYAEFSYMLIMWYDFYYLNKEYGVDLEVWWSDEWDGILAWIEITRKLWKNEVYGATINLVKDSTGRKFGKSEWNAIWLSAEKNSPYVCYNYFMNCGDEDIQKYLLLFTLLTPDEIQDIVDQHIQESHLRKWHTRLAYEVTKIIYGEKAANHCVTIKQLLYENKNPSDHFDWLDSTVLNEIYRALGWVDISTSWSNDPVSNKLTTVIVWSWLVGSNSEAKKAIKSNAISLNGKKITDIGYELTHTDFINNYALVKKWKKTFKMVKLQG